MKEHYFTPDFMAALCKAQGELSNPLKTGKSQGYVYVELDVILDLVRPVLAKHGLGLTQSWTERDGKDLLVTLLFHTSGGYLHSEMPLRLGNLRHGSDMQQLGAALTYARKYSVLALLGLVGDKDEDAAPPEPSRKKPVFDAMAGTLKALTTDSEYEAYLEELATKTGRTKVDLRQASMNNPEAALSKLMEWKVSRATLSSERLGLRPE